MVQRKLPSWLLAYAEYTRNVEAPSSFNVWVGISTIASALQRKVWLNFEGFHVKIYPSLFVVLTAPPGICRKGTVINIGLDLIRKLKGPYIVANDITREKLLKEMAEHPFQAMIGGKPHVHCSVTCVAEEFSTLLGVKDIELLATLTALWNCDPEYKYSTKGAGDHIVTNVFCNILAGTTPQWLSSSLPLEAIGGGFTSRVVFVVESSTEKIVCLTDRPPRVDPELERNLLHDLGDMYSNMKGEMTWTEEAGLEYNKWYHKFKTSPPEMQDDRFLHYLSRKPVMIWKVAMCLSASESSGMVISKDHLKMAIELLDILEVEMPKAFGGLGTSEVGDSMHKVRSYLQASPTGLTMQQLMALLWAYVKSTQELSMILNNWICAGTVSRTETPGGTVFKWIGK